MYSKLDELNKTLILFKNKRKHGDYEHAYSPCLSDYHYLKRIQFLMSEIYNCKVWYGGSLSLFLQKKTDKFGDLDIITNKIFKKEDLAWEVNNETDFSYQTWDFDLDIFFKEKTNQKIVDFFNNNTVKVNNILVQDWKIVNAINWYWRETPKKRQFTEPDNKLKKQITEIFS